MRRKRTSKLLSLLLAAVMLLGLLPMTAAAEGSSGTDPAVTGTRVAEFDLYEDNELFAHSCMIEVPAGAANLEITIDNDTIVDGEYSPMYFDFVDAEWFVHLPEGSYTINGNKLTFELANIPVCTASDNEDLEFYLNCAENDGYSQWKTKELGFLQVDLEESGLQYQIYFYYGENSSASAATGTKVATCDLYEDNELFAHSCLIEVPAGTANLEITIDNDTIVDGEYSPMYFDFVDAEWFVHLPEGSYTINGNKLTFELANIPVCTASDNEDLEFYLNCAENDGYSQWKTKELGFLQVDLEESGLQYQIYFYYTASGTDPNDNILINDKSLTTITGAGFGDTPVYLAYLEEGTTSYTFAAPDGWYVRTRNAEGYATCSFIEEGLIDNASWYNDPSIAAMFLNGASPYNEEKIAEVLAESGCSAKEEYIPIAFGCSNDEFLPAIGLDSIEQFWSTPDYSLIIELAEKTLEPLDYYNAYFSWDMFNNSSVTKDIDAEYNLLYFYSDIDQLLNHEVNPEYAEALVLVQIGGVIAEPTEPEITINEHPLTAITGVNTDIPVYLAQLEERTTSYAFAAPDGWYVRTRNAEGYATCSFIEEGLIDNASWYNDSSIAAMFLNGASPYNEEKIAEVLAESGCSTKEEYIPSVFGCSNDEFLPAIGLDSIEQFWSTPDYSLIIELAEKTLEPLDYYNAYFSWDMFNNSSVTKDIDAEYNLLYFYSDIDQLLNHEVNPEYAEALVLVQIGGSIASEEADKTALQAALISVPTSGYYKTEDNDNWNGKAYSATGYWAELQAIVKVAQDVFDNNTATQDEVDAATASLNQEDPDSDLSKAIAKLIPDTQLNATGLYEAVIAEQKQNRQKSRYTVDTWADYAEAKSAAEHYLFEELFNADGSANTAVNKAANQNEADGYADALIRAAANLYTVAARDAARKSLQRGWEMLTAMIELAEQAKKEDYTETSWNAFADKLAEAKSITEPVPTFTPVDRTTAQALFAKFNELYQSFYCELIPKGTVTVTLQCLDPYHVRHKAGIELPYEYIAAYGTEIFAGALQKVTLTGTPTLEAALSAVGLGINDAASNSAFGTKVLINGVYVTENYAEASYDTRPNIYSSVILHPGDRVTVIWDTDPLSGLGQTVGYAHATLWQYENSLAVMRFAEGGETIETIEAHAAEPFTVALEKASAALTGERDYSPAEGMAVLVSETQTEAAGNHPTAAFAEENGERILSAADGSITMTLYEEGWVLLAAFDVEADVMGDDATSGMTIGDYHSVNFGAVVWVHVLPAEDMEAVKKQLKEELTALRDAYPESIFAEADWESVNEICDAALTGIDAAADIGTARRLQQTAISEIKAIQERTLRENEQKPAAFRAALAKMPEDLTLLTEAQLSQVEALIAAYEALTPYQQTLLTESEVSRYEEIKALYDAGLGASTSYSLTLAVTADTAEATAAAQDFTAWLRSHTATADQIGDVPAVQLGEYGAFWVINSQLADPASAQPLQNIRLVTNLNYSLWFLLRDAESHTLSGDGWTVSDTDVTLSPSIRSLANDVTGSVTVLFNGVEYEVKGISVEGVDADDLRWSTQSCLDTSTYKGKSKNNVNLYFDETWLEFSMPYQDVTVTVEWQPVSPMSRLEAAYRSYSKADYTAANWNVLTAAYEEGKTRIAAAADSSAANTALAEAVAAMAAVPRRGENELGCVYVTVRNDTGKTANGAAWTGVLVENMVVDLRQNSTMMNCIGEALAGHSVIGLETGYISSIDGLAEFSCGKQSGWMGTLNDWFVNEGFSQFTVANDKLHDGDVICVEYTCALGLDIRGGTGKNKDTTLYDLALTNGTMTPEFDSAVTEYVFALDSGAAETEITFTNNNRSFQSRAYLNGYAPTANNWIRSGDAVTVGGGDVITVGVGEGAWPAMGTGTPTKYTITIISPDDASGAVKLINAIGSVTYANYKTKQAAVDLADAAYEALNADAQANVTNLNKLTAAKAAVAGFRAVDELRGMIADLPRNITEEDRAAVEAAMALYESLTPAQRNLLSLYETNKLLNAVNALAYGTVETLTVKTEQALVTSRVADGTATIHVAAESPCLVAVKSGEDYERLAASPNADGGYDFVKSGYTEDMEFYVLLKGDANGDGELTGLDVTLCKSAFLGREALDELGALAADPDGDGFGGDDVTVIKSAFLGEEELEW